MGTTGISENWAVSPNQINLKSLEADKPEMAKYGKQENEEVSQKTQGTLAEIEARENNAETENINEEKLANDVEKINKVVDLYNEELRFSVHKDSGRVMVAVVNKETGEVIKEIPPRKFLDWLVQFHNFIGAIIDTKV